MPISEEKLLRMKKEIEEAKQTVSELKGKSKLLLQQLSEKWECKDVKQAHKKVDELEKEIKTLQSSIDTQIKELEGKYNFT